MYCLIRSIVLTSLQMGLWPYWIKFPYSVFSLSLQRMTISFKCSNIETSRNWYYCHRWLPPPLLSARGHSENDKVRCRVWPNSRSLTVKTTKSSTMCGRTAGHWLWKRPSPVPCVDEQQVTDCENDQVQYHVWTNSRSLTVKTTKSSAMCGRTAGHCENDQVQYHMWTNSRSLWKRPSPVPCVDEQQVIVKTTKSSTMCRRTAGHCENDQVQYHMWTNSRSLWKRPSPVPCVDEQQVIVKTTGKSSTMCGRTAGHCENDQVQYHVWTNSRSLWKRPASPVPCVDEQQVIVKTTKSGTIIPCVVEQQGILRVGLAHTN